MYYLFLMKLKHILKLFTTENYFITLCVAAILRLRRRKPINQMCHLHRPWARSLHTNTVVVQADPINRHNSSRADNMAVRVVINKVTSNIHLHQILIMLIIKIGNMVKAAHKLTDLIISGDLTIIINISHVIAPKIIILLNVSYCTFSSVLFY